MRWPFTSTDPMSPIFLVFLKSLDAITTYVFLNHNLLFGVYEKNKFALYLWDKMGYLPSTILVSIWVYLIGILIRATYNSNMKYGKWSAEFCYNIYVFTFVGVAFWNYYIAFDTWWFYYVL